MRISGVLLAAVLLSLASCGPKRIPDSCNGVICTAMFSMLNVTLLDSSGTAYIPDRVETFDAQANLLGTRSQAALPGESIYTYIDDNDREALGVNQVNDVTFRVIKNNVVVAEKIFQVKADCCHVIKVSGVDTLIIR